MSGPRAGWLCIAALLVAASMLVPAAASAASLRSPTFHAPLSPDTGYANLSNPTAQILFGSPLPRVQILPTSNSSLGATLDLVYLLEIAPNVSDPNHPLVLSAAAPQTLQHFNSSIALHGTTPYVRLTAALPVFPANSSLWAHGTDVAPTAGAQGQAILDVNYSAQTAADGSPGVLVSWSVSGWPWANPSGDELALEYIVQVVSGSGFQTCAGTSGTNNPSATCPQSLSEGTAVWGSSVTALKGTGPAGSAAWVSWSPKVGSSENQSPPVNVGAYLEEPGTSALVIAAPADGAEAVTGATLFFLSPGPLGSLNGPLARELPAYGAAAAVFAAVAAVGVLASRRRDRTIERELSA